MPLAQSVAAANAGPLDVIVAGGPAVQREMNPALRRDLVRAELVAGALSLVVLVLVLGSLAAGIVPLVLALFVIPIVLSIVFALSHLTDVTVFAPNVVTLVGLGIAIDYSLLVVYRFREELARGLDVPAAVARTMQTAVRAVVFSGVTVAIGLGVLLLVRVPFVQSFGLAGILIPAVTIVAALTLLPAVLSLIGHRINRFRVVPERVLTAPESRPWRRVAEQIMRAPLVFLVIGGAAILLAAAPVRHLALGATPLAVYPNTGPAAEGEKLLAAEFGLGGVAPVRILVDRPAADVQAALPAIRVRARRPRRPGRARAARRLHPDQRLRHRRGRLTRRERPRAAPAPRRAAAGPAGRRLRGRRRARRCSTTSSRRSTATSCGSR